MFYYTLLPTIACAHMFKNLKNIVAMWDTILDVLKSNW